MWVRGNASSMTRELDAAFRRSEAIGQDAYPKSPGREAMGMTEVLEGPGRGERIFPDVEKTPPVLAGEWATGLALVGMFSSSPDLVLPMRLGAADFAAGAGDDPTASRDENELWRETLLLLADTLDALFLEAQETVARVRVAEELAERRRGPVVEEFRARVIQQMAYASDELYSPQQLSEWLSVLQTDRRLLSYLALLERSALRAEELQVRIRIGQEAYAQMLDNSEEQMNAGESIQAVLEETRGLDFTIRRCIQEAREGPETLDAYEKLGEELDKINPFKLFR